jgi:ankyrin repeat protein
MIRFLISKGANVNAPAHPNEGLTALQAALNGDHAVEAAEILLHHGADASAPPSTLDGPTTLEALCNNRRADVAESAQQLCHKLLDAGATVNRPGGEASSAIHGVIDKGWHEVLARCLEPQHNAIVNGIWWHDFDNEFTPTQRAANKGDLKALTMLLDYGADVNEAAAEFFGRTALQAAALLRPGPKKMAIVNLLLERSADINADPAAEEGGVTALQAAAIAGDLMLAELFISHGADVNAWSPSGDCRTAIEGAAEHGRLDMVQLLLNAGATGDVTQTTGFELAIELAEENGHFAVARLLKEQEGSTVLSGERGAGILA